MSFSESDRVQIRKYLGYANQWLQADPRLESAITNIQSISDGGSRPNPSPSAAETDVRGIITILQGIDAQIENLGTLVGAHKVDGGETEIDAAREMVRLSMRGRVHVHRLARSLDTMPRSDIFGSAPQMDASYPYAANGGRDGY